MGYAFNLTPGWVETRGPFWAASIPELVGSRFRERLCIKEGRGEQLRRTPNIGSGLHIPVHTRRHKQRKTVPLSLCSRPQLQFQKHPERA